MLRKRLLLLSNSTNYGEPYLSHPCKAVKDFPGETIKRVLFIPFAGVRFSYDDYAAKVRQRFSEAQSKRTAERMDSRDGSAATMQLSP